MHRALRRIPRRRTLALTGTPIENRLGDLWAIMDLVNPGLLGSREAFERSLARPIEARGDARALERLALVVGPFVLRRAKDAPEVDLELPPITITKVECRLTVEQASLYRATVDRWMPRIERHERASTGGAPCSDAGQLKQVCNHPEMIVSTGMPSTGARASSSGSSRSSTRSRRRQARFVLHAVPRLRPARRRTSRRVSIDVGFFHGGLGTAYARARRPFDEQSDPTYLRRSLRAGGRGLNLPAANHVFHFDRW